MDQTLASEGSSRSGNQEISSVQWNPKVHYRFHENPSPIPILSQMNPAHTFSPYYVVS